MSSRSLIVAFSLVALMVVVAAVPSGARGGSPIDPPAVVLVSCSPNANPTFSVNVTWNSTGGWVGPAPTNVTLGVHLTGSIGEYNYSLGFGDTTRSSGSLWQNGSGGSSVTNLSHGFALAGNYSINITAYWQCTLSNQLAASNGSVLSVLGAAGPDPIRVAASATSSYVPGTVTYNATVLGRPAGSTLEWGVGFPGDTNYGWYDNFTSLNLTPLAPGGVGGTLYVVYPNGLVYASTPLRSFDLLPNVNVSVAFAPPPAGSPTTTTFTATVGPNGGAPTIPGSSIEWSTPWGLPSGVTVTGNLSGPIVDPTFFYNSSVPSNTSLSFQATSLASVALPGGGPNVVVVLGSSIANVPLQNTTGASGPPVLALWVPNSSFALRNVSQGGLHFTVDALLQGPSGGGPPSGGPWELQIQVYPACQCSGSVGGSSTGLDWDGTTLAVPQSVAEYGAPGQVEGNLTVVAQVFEGAANSSRVDVTEANLTVVPPSNLTVPTSGTPPALNLALTTSSSNGEAPLNVTLNVSADGGTLPYSLSVCLEGPSSSVPATGSCTTVGSVITWSGAAVGFIVTLDASGYYTAMATVTDSDLSSTSAAANLYASAAVGRPILLAQGSVIGPSSGDSDTGTYEFVTTVSGGYAPYDIQWSFGDGTSGSTLPGGTISHTYRSDGTYVATLRVTDARGTVVTSTVGPFPVTLAPAATPTASPGLRSFDTVLLASAVLVGLASVGALVVVSRWAVGRREALNWLDDLEHRRGPGGPPPP